MTKLFDNLICACRQQGMNFRQIEEKAGLPEGAIKKLLLDDLAGLPYGYSSWFLSDKMADICSFYHLDILAEYLGTDARELTEEKSERGGIF